MCFFVDTLAEQIYFIATKSNEVVSSRSKGHFVAYSVVASAAIDMRNVLFIAFVRY